MIKVGTLIFFCGKMGAGKLTKSKEFALKHNAVLLSEDEWLSILYPQQISSFDDYIKFSALLRPLIKSHVQKILSTGTNVVLNFPANTAKQRTWFKSIVNEINAQHQLIYLEVSDKQCITSTRNAIIYYAEKLSLTTNVITKKFFETKTYIHLLR